MSTVRSRSPRYKRGYSFSSLSSGSLDNVRTSSYSQKSKSRKDHNRDNRRNDKKFTRRYSQERRLDKDPHYDSRLTEQSKQDKERDRNSKDQQYDSPEESYLEPASSLHKGHNTTILSLEKEVRHVGHNDIEESLRDPSTCNFRSIVQHMSENEDLDHVVVDERKIDKDETSTRIDRLERLVELLAKSNKAHSPPNQITQDGNWTPNVNLFELIPRNSNFTTSMWLNKLQEECIERNFDEKSTIQFMQSKMTGVIKAWFKTVSSYDFTWPELKMLITETFPDNIDFASTLRLVVERTKKPDETITQYYFSKMYLLEACKITGANAVSCLIDGLGNEFWKQEAKSQNFLTPESLYSQFLSKCTDYGNDEECGQIGQYQPRAQEFVDTFHINTEHKFIRNDKPNYKSKRCFTCKKFGHITVDCRHAPICYRCKNKGHIAVNCSM